MEWRFIWLCVKCASQLTLEWSRANKLGLRVYFAVAPALLLGYALGGASREQVRIAAVAGLLAIGLLVLSVFVAAIPKTPTELRRRAMQPSRAMFTGTVRNDELHQWSLEMLRELDYCRKVAANRGASAACAKNAEVALAKLAMTIEGFGRLAESVGLDRVSRKRRRAAHELYEGIKSPTLDADLAGFEKQIRLFSKTW